MSQTIFMIYGRPSHKGPVALETLGADYFLLYAFDHGGMIEREILVDSYESIYQRKPEESDFLGPFASTDELGRLAFHLCEVRQTDRAVLLTCEEYNEKLEESQNKEELLEKLAESGQSIENLEGPRKGLLGKIFR